MQRLYVKTRGVFLDNFFKKIHDCVTFGFLSSRWQHANRHFVIEFDRYEVNGNAKYAYQYKFDYHEEDECQGLKMNLEYGIRDEYAEYYIDCSSSLADEIETVLKEMMKHADCGHCLECTVYIQTEPDVKFENNTDKYTKFVYDGDGSDRIMECGRTKIFIDYRKLSQRESLHNCIMYSKFVGREPYEPHLNELAKIEQGLKKYNVQWSTDFQEGKHHFYCWHDEYALKDEQESEYDDIDTGDGCYMCDFDNSDDS